MSQDSVLIVDSNEAFATILREGLEQSNEYTTTVTANGAEARQGVQQLGEGEPRRMRDPHAVPLAHPGGGQPAGPLARSLVELRVGERAVVRHDGEVIGSCPRCCAEPILHALSDG